MRPNYTCKTCGVSMRKSKSMLCRTCWNKARRVPNRERFYSHVGPANAKGCKLWLLALDRDGYGHFTLNNNNGTQRQVRAHHAALLIEGIDIPRDKEVCHECDNPPCVERTHLRVDTHASNIADRDRQGHQIHGTTHHQAKVTDADVIEMRHRREELGDTYAALGSAFGVCAKQAWRIINRKSWPHL